MNAEFKKHVQEPYNEAWDILKIVRDDNSDDAWDRFRVSLDKFYERIEAVKPIGSKEYIKGERQYLEHLYSAMLEMGEMAAWILNHEEENTQKTTR